MSVPAASLGFTIAVLAMVYFGAVVYAETVGATIDQMTLSDETAEFEDI